MRYHSADYVKKELIFLKEKYSAKKILLSDDNFTADHNRAIEIFKFMHKNDLEIHCQGGFTMHSLNKEMLIAMKDSGINSIHLPIESGSEKVLKTIMHKPLNHKLIKKVVKNCREIGIDTIGFIVLGLPNETLEDIQESIDFLSSIDVNWYNITVAAPLLGSELYDICDKNNYLKGDHFYSDYRRAVIETEHFTPKFIEEKAYEMNLFLNFVNNLDMKDGNYKKALNRFESVANASDNHAFAYYYMSKCFEKLNEMDKHQRAMNKYLKIIDESPLWKKYAEKLGLYSSTKDLKKSA